MTWQFVIVGSAVGLIVGMTGIGGGSLMTPMLIMFFGFTPKVAVGTDILHGASSSRSAPCGTGRSAPSTGGSRSGCSSAPARVARRRCSSRGYLGDDADADARADRRRGGDRGRDRVRGEAVHPPCHAAEDVSFSLSRRDKLVAIATRRGRRLPRRADVGRQRHLLRPRDAARLPADTRRRSSARTWPTRPRCSGSPARPPAPRQRRRARDAVAAGRLDPRHSHLEPLDRRRPADRRSASGSVGSSSSAGSTLST